MSGYTPVFGSIYDGTLHGRWPAAPVFVSLLPLTDKRGEIRLTYEAISARTGWPMPLLREGIAHLMAPDPGSQSDAEEGRRLVLLQPGRLDWGWRVVNHALYRERARKQAWDADRTASGRDAERKRLEREHASRRVPTGPDAGRLSPLSDADTDADANADGPSPADTYHSVGGVVGTADRGDEAPPRAAALTAPALMKIPCAGKKSFAVTAAYVQQLRTEHPLIDVLAELEKVRQLHSARAVSMPTRGAFDETFRRRLDALDREARGQERVGHRRVASTEAEWTRLNMPAPERDP
jgi:hypothetical protein